VVLSPRLGFLGLGWIGRNRMQALLDSGLGTVVAVADPDAEAARQSADATGALARSRLEELLELGLDGIVIASPSALHAGQAILALESGVPVFVQKPLARSAAEAEAVLAVAQQLGRPFGVDLSYRHTRAAQRMRSELRSGRIGQAFAAQLVFHNAYGPDKEWFLDRRRSGGGCMIDLGTHLIDLLLWLLGGELHAEAAALLRKGAPLGGGENEVEDYAAVQLRTEAGAPVQLACSWFLPAGRDCAFECTLYGTVGSLAMTNIGGSFYDFQLELRQGTQAEILVSPPDEWGGRALCEWARRLAAGDGFDTRLAKQLQAVSAVIDAVYDARLATVDEG